MPSLTNLKKSLDPIRDLVKKILQEKRLAEPTEEELNAGIEESADDGEAGGEMSSGGSSGVAGTSGPIKSRQDALKRLSEIAEYFRKTEPHSPVASLVQRSVKWGNMPLDSLLQELVKDATVLDHIRETLGMAGSSESSSPEPEAESTESGW
jgi:type VI secretion system protein ImpA